VSAAEIVWTKPDGTTLTKKQFDAEIERIEVKLRDGMKAELEYCRIALTQGRLAQAQRLLDDMGAHPYLLFQAGPELASAEAYGIAEDFRALFQDRIDWVNFSIRYAGEGFKGGVA